MVKIVIGCGKNKNVIDAVENIQNAIFNNIFKDLEIEIVNSNENFIESYNNNDVDALIRGSLKSSDIISQIAKINKKTINRATYIKENFKNNFNSNNFNNSNFNSNFNSNSNFNFNSNAISNLNNNSHYHNLNGKFEFLLLPVGIDEGKNINERFKMAIEAIKFMNNINKSSKIAILSGAREGDIGRSKEIDKSLNDSTKLFKMINDYINDSNQTNNLKNTVKNYNILIEQAINDKNNIIIAPDGIIGNILFRTLVLLNNWKSYGAIALNSKKIFIDTSRDQSTDGYERSIILAYNLIKNQKNSF
ncbi:MAG: hypothetical protein LBM96_00825 [Methanobrevibacter sp.]|jgi:predicted methyltransferase MtxX (methanogen marker protein 4)|nr:hypothetical protein [Candidatus Methanoflexus mossambicus]